MNSEIITNTSELYLRIVKCLIEQHKKKGTNKIGCKISYSKEINSEGFGEERTISVTVGNKVKKVYSERLITILLSNGFIIYPYKEFFGVMIDSEKLLEIEKSFDYLKEMGYHLWYLFLVLYSSLW